MTRALILGVSLIALAACSTDKHLLAPDPEAKKMISPEYRTYDRGEDPVCGASLDKHQHLWYAEYQGVEYAFDSEACRQQFMDNPGLYSDTVR